MCVLCVNLLIELHEQTWVKGTYFNVVYNFHHILQNVKFKWHFSPSQHFSMDDPVHGLTLRINLFDPGSETRKLSSLGRHSIHAYTNIKWPSQFSLYIIQDLSSSAAAVLVGNKNTHIFCISSWKNIAQKQESLPCCQHWWTRQLDCIPWWLTNPNNWASMSSVISSSRLVTVLAQRGTHATFRTAVSHKSSRQMSIAAGRINSSQIVKSFLVLPMQLGTKNDALRADTFDEVVAFNNCFSSSCSHFFSFEKLQSFVF